MPVIDGIYTKDFPDLGRALLGTDIIVIAEAGNPITYKSTVSALITATSQQVVYTQADLAGPSGFDNKYIVVSGTLTVDMLLTCWINSAQYGNVYNLFSPVIYFVGAEMRLKGFPDEDFTIKVNYL